MARRRVRLLAVLRARRAASRACDVDQSELSALVSGRAGEKSPRLGPAARPTVPRVEAVVTDSGTGCREAARAVAARHSQRAMARVSGPRRPGLARAGAGP